MSRVTRRRTKQAVLWPVCLSLCVLALLPGCSKKEPEPSVPGYFSGQMKPKSEVAPSPGGAKAKPGGKGASVGD
jgi:hypothetical protein